MRQEILTPKEKTLVKRFNRGDMHALREIYDLYKHDLLTLATALLRDGTTAEDAVHDVFAKLAGSGRRIKILGSLRGYLLTAVANTVRSMLRKAGRSLSLPGSEKTGQQGLPDSAAILGEDQQWLSEALKSLSHEQREVLMLRYFGDLNFKAIAKSQEVSINTVQGRHRYGLEKLRSLLGGDL